MKDFVTALVLLTNGVVLGGAVNVLTEKQQAASRSGPPSTGGHPSWATSPAQKRSRLFFLDASDVAAVVVHKP